MPALVVTPSAELPDLLDLAIDHLHVDGLDDRDLILSYLQAAVSEFESATGRPVLLSTWDCFWDSFPTGSTLRLVGGKTASVATVSYLPAASGEPTVWPATNYTLDLASDPGRLVLAAGAVWPSDALVSANGVVVRRVAGWTLAELPADIRIALLFRVQSMFDGGSSNPTATELYLKRLDAIWTQTVRRYHSY